MFVRDCMTHNPATLRPDSDPLAGVAICKGGGFRHLPVVDAEGHVLGVISRVALELFLAKSRSPGVMKRQHCVDQVEIRDVPSVQPDWPLEVAANLMVEHKTSCLPVVQDDQLIGIVTETNLFEALLEIFSGQQKGIRLTALTPNLKGTLGVISTAIAEARGDILSLNVFKGTAPDNRGLTLKVAGASREELVKAVEPMVLEILDVREV
ncbi:MAG: CBS domain-containing protein [Chloroflexi bacterium]|nr:CBS domain-containing protein [Chloroflexota bacterium]